MRANYLLNNDKTIKLLISEPLDESKPIIEVEDIHSIKLGLDKIIDGVLVEFEGVDPALAAINKNKRIAELKQFLAASDYLCLKHADGALTDEEYAETKAQRQAWRQEINELEQ